MMPDNNTQRGQPFPQGFEHLEEWLKAAESRLQQLDAELNLPDQRPALRYDPPGFGAAPQPPRRSKEVIQKERDDLKADEYKRIEKATERATPNIRKDIQDSVFVRLYREDIDKLKEDERGLPAHNAGWNIDDGQVKLHKKLTDYRDSERAVQPELRLDDPIAPRPADVEPPA